MADGQRLTLRLLPCDKIHPQKIARLCTGLAVRGSIRSATFCLGELQIFEEKGLMPHVDNLSWPRAAPLWQH